MDDARLGLALVTTAQTERAVRYHLSATPGQAREQALGQIAYRHAVALRKALEDWIETRAAVDTEETVHGQVR